MNPIDPTHPSDPAHPVSAVGPVELGRAAVLERFRWIAGEADLWRVFTDGPSLAAVVQALLAPWREAGISHVAGVESRGFLLGAPCALALGVGFLGIRKDHGGLLPGQTISERTEPDYRGNRHTLRVQRAVGPGDHVLLVDDWAERGSQALSAKALIERCGARWAGCSIVVDELTDATRDALKPLTSLVRADQLGEPAGP